jgi:hypothetical protein
MLLGGEERRTNDCEARHYTFNKLIHSITPLQQCPYGIQSDQNIFLYNFFMGPSRTTALR